MSLSAQGWARLDNVGNLFPAVQSARNTGYFRLSAVFDHEPPRELIQASLQDILPRYPFFDVELSRNLFWHLVVPARHAATVLPDSRIPNLLLAPKVPARHPWRVRLYGRRLSVEFHHSLTDGTGALAFLRSLVCTYLERAGVRLSTWLDIPRPGEAPRLEEAEDAYAKIPFEANLPLPPAAGKAFQHPGPRLARGSYRATLGFLSVDLALARARERGLSLTEFLTGVYLLAWQEVFFRLRALGLGRRAPIRLMIPVNLRQLFPSPTLLNFFLPVSVELDPRLGVWSEEEVFDRVRSQLRLEINAKSIRQRINANLRGVKWTPVRLLPLPLKQLFLRMMYHSGEKEQTSALSNMGVVRLPPEAEARLLRFEFLPPPSPGTKVAASVISFRNTLAIGIGRICRGSLVEAAFFRRLREFALPVKIEANFSPTVEDAWPFAHAAE